MNARLPIRLADLLLGSLLLCASASAAGAPSDPSRGSDWAHWLGPNYDGSSPEKGLLREWPTGGPKVLWRAKIKQGWSCPSVAGNDVVVAMTEFDAGQYSAKREIVVCLDAATGRPRWEYAYPVNYNRNTVGWANGGVRSTPTLTDKRVYSIDPLGNIVCLDRADGKVVWQKALAPQYFYPRNFEQKGFNCSPLVYNDVLVVHSGGEKCYNYTLALDAKTGKQLWVSEDVQLREKSKAGGHGQSPVLALFNKEPCALVCYNRYLRAFRITDGKEVFKFDAVPPDGRNTNTPSPLVVGNRIVIVPDCARMTCVEVDRKDPKLSARMAWESPDYYGFCAYGGFVHHDGYLYGIDAYSTDGNKVAESPLIFDCIDLKTGKRVWKQDGFRHGYSIITADGLLFLRTFQTLTLVEATPRGFVVKGKMEKVHSVGSRTVMDARGLTDCVMPVLSRGKLYVRCPEELLCLDVRGAGK